MSVPFTVNGTNWQEKAEELRLAYSERSRAADGLFAGNGNWLSYIYSGGAWNFIGSDTEDTPIQGGENLQSESFWNGMQRGIEALVEYASKLEHDFSSSTTLRYYDEFPNPFLQFCKEVGGLLYVSDEDYGWPKCSELDEEFEPVMTRGRFTAPDYISADMVDAMVLAFQNLTVFVADLKGSENETNTEYNGSAPNDPIAPPSVDLQLAYDDALANSTLVPSDPDTNIRGMSGRSYLADDIWYVEMLRDENLLVFDQQSGPIAIAPYEVWGVKTFESTYTFNPSGLTPIVNLPGAPVWPNPVQPWYASGGAFSSTLIDRQRYSSITTFDFTNS